MIIDGANKELYEIIMDVYDEHHLNNVNDFSVNLINNFTEEQLPKLKLFAEILSDLENDLGIKAKICFYEA